MKIAVMADIHGNMAYLSRAKKIIDESKLEIVIVCGDLQDEEVLIEIDTWKQKVYVAFGNADYALREMLERQILKPKQVEISLDYGSLTIGGTKIA